MDDARAVQSFVEGVTPERRRRDAERLLELMGRVSGEPARLHGSIIGFGAYHYRYPSGREGDGPALSFSPRKAATSVYLVDGVDRHADGLARLGPHTTGVGCLYLRDLDAVDLEVLESILRSSYRAVTDGTYLQRARDGAAPETTG